MAPTDSLESKIIPVPPSLQSRNPLNWFRFIGPGAIIASVTIGSGELVFPSRGGCLFGYHLLWIFPVCALLKWVMTYTGMRHMILTGAHPLERWTWLPGPRGWLPLSMCVMVFICLPMWFSFLSGLLGAHSATIFGIGDKEMWATVWIVVAVCMLARGGYEFLERAQMVILALMLLGAVVALVWVQPDWLAAVKGFLWPHPLAYPDWAFEVEPKLRERSIWVEVVVYVTLIGGGSEDYLAYASFLRDKKWGRSHLTIAGDDQLEDMARQSDHPARLWVRAALIDTIASFASVVLIASIFVILGAVILQPAQLIPADDALLTYQANFLTEISPWLKYLYNLAVFLAFFGILLGGPELSYRLIFEYLHTLPRYRECIDPKKLRAACIGWALGAGLLLLWVVRIFKQQGWVSQDVELLDIVTPAGIYTGLLGCAIYCLANLWADGRFLPAPLRMSRTLVLLNLTAGVIFILITLKTFWDYDGIRAFGIFVGMLAGCLLLARSLRFAYEKPSR